MAGAQWLGVALVMVLLSSCQGQSTSKYRICADARYTKECQSIDRGSSEVSCVMVTGSIDCMTMMAERKVDFASFTSEETVLGAKMKKDDFSVIASLRHKEKITNKFAFQSVVVVKNHTNGLAGLDGGRLCHPGYGKAKEQMWSNRVLKYFERKVTDSKKKCLPASKSSAEDEAHLLKDFFPEACRPGVWLSEKSEDVKLKEKFTSLCVLCTSNREPNCDGYKYFEPLASGAAVNSHLSALNCLSRSGTVAYVGYQHLVEFLKGRDGTDGFSIMCENGTTIPFGVSNAGLEAPCAWINQPWGTVMARKDISKELLSDLKKWIPTGQSETNSPPWVSSLATILFEDPSYSLNYENDTIAPDTYVVKGRPIPNAESTPCHKALRLCTINKEEYNKCLWVQGATTTLGLEPEIECVQGESPLKCLSMIQKDSADFISIDSNLGFLGRKHYNLTSAIYQEFNRDYTSKVFAVIKETHKGEISRFENLRDKNACFPEYGGIGWVAFINAAHSNRIISQKECDYADQIVKFFKASCAPGALDEAHFPSKTADNSKLCSACRGFSPRINEEGIHSSLESPEKECPADETNEFYGNKGALRCLSKADSHVAFIEGQNLKTHAADLKLQPNDFRILCKNGTLALYPGFDVDAECALSVTVDGEVLRRRGFPDSLNLQLYLQDIDNWFGYDTGNNPMIDFHIFSEFNNTKNLLFKDETVGFATKDSTNKQVLNYVELFKHTESCTGGAMSTASISMMTLLSAVFVHLYFKL